MVALFHQFKPMQCTIIHVYDIHAYTHGPIHNKWTQFQRECIKKKHQQLHWNKSEWKCVHSKIGNIIEKFVIALQCFFPHEQRYTTNVVPCVYKCTLYANCAVPMFNSKCYRVCGDALELSMWAVRLLF